MLYIGLLRLMLLEWITVQTSEVGNQQSAMEPHIAAKGQELAAEQGLDPGWIVEQHRGGVLDALEPVSYTHLRAHETVLALVCRLLLEKQKTKKTAKSISH